MKTLMLAVAVSGGLGAVSVLQVSTISWADWRPSITPVAAPSGANSAQPQMTVSPRGILLSWIERAGTRATLKFSERTATGWSPATTVAAGDDWFVNWADVPSVLRLDDGTLAAHWLQKSGAETYAYDVRLAYSKDDGRTWSNSFTPHHDGTKREHGFASLFQMPGSGLGLIWLDGRAMGSAEGHDAHGADDGAMSVRFGTFDRSWKQTSEMPVDLRVCECCPTTAAMTSDGPIVAYRNRSEDEIRDIYVARLENGAWTEPKAAHDDNWKIAACPVNGPMLSARGRDVVLAWFTVKDDVGHAYAAFSSDAGRTFGTPIRLDEASALGRVDVALLPDGSALATWIEFAEQKSSFSMRRIDASGRTSPVTAVSAISGARASGYPRISVHGGEAVFAWTENDSGHATVKTATLQLNVAPGSAR
ncbi:MAG: sialidase family protein [Vicinamibacterales bacterium]